FVAWAGFLFGSAMSIGGNILYTWMPRPPEGAPDGWVPPPDWAPSGWAQIGAAAWPTALLISVEVMSRVDWPDESLWKLARWGGITAVALGSAIISYGHLSHVLSEWDYGFGAYIGPLAIDGRTTLCGCAILARDPTPQRVAEQAKDEQPAVDEPGPEEPQPAPTRVPDPEPQQTQPPKPQQKITPRTVPLSDEEMERARQLRAQGAGRGTFKKEFGLNDNQAKNLAAILSQTGQQPS